MSNKYKENLTVGQIFNSYKQICEALGFSIEAGNSKKAQIKEWERFFNFSKQGQKIIIEEIYDIPKEKTDNRNGGNNKITTPLIESNPKLASEWLVDKNGMEINDAITRRTQDKYWWKCSECGEEIYESPLKRIKANKGVTDDCIACPYCALSKSAKIIYKYLKENNVVFETEYTFKDLKGLNGGVLRFDFAIFDFENNKLIALLEYDGEYHDDAKDDIEKYVTLIIHDKLKDEYCNKNNIPLLRIHYTEIELLHIKVENYLTSLNIPITKSVIEQLKEREIKETVERIVYHQNKINELHKYLEEIQNESSLFILSKQGGKL